MICLMLRDLPRNFYWEDGRQVSAFSLKAGSTTLHDLKREPAALMDKPIHSLLWYLPRTALNSLADQGNVPRISELRYTPGVAVFDETVKHIGLSLLPALRSPERVNRLFADRCDAGIRSSCCTNLWWNADGLETAQGRGSLRGRKKRSRI